MTRQKIEIMSPVGSYEALYAAIEAGCNSVYFGVEGLNMRSRSANNFSIDDLRKIASIATEHGVRSYLTLNTVVYDTEMDYMKSIVLSVELRERRWRRCPKRPMAARTAVQRYAFLSLG